MLSSVRFSAAFKTADAARAQAKYDEEAARLGSKDAKQVSKSILFDKGKPDTYLVCSEGEAERLEKVVSSYQHASARVRGRHESLEMIAREKDALDAYVKTRNEILATAVDLDK